MLYSTRLMVIKSKNMQHECGSSYHIALGSLLKLGTDGYSLRFGGDDMTANHLFQPSSTLGASLLRAVFCLERAFSLSIQITLAQERQS